jgi:hypothetical protein
MKIVLTEDVRPGDEFRLVVKPGNKAPACFITIVKGDIFVTRRLQDFLQLPLATPVVANWHGERRTDAFATTVGELRELAAHFDPPKKW